MYHLCCQWCLLKCFFCLQTSCHYVNSTTDILLAMFVLVYTLLCCTSLTVWILYCYRFCGHGFGHFVTTSCFQQLSCNSTALLIGCSSGKLTERGRCDPNGSALNFLTSGWSVLMIVVTMVHTHARKHTHTHTRTHTHSPSVLGCLWDVTDGDIDRFCLALLKAKTTESTFLPLLVSSSRKACKLPYIIGGAPVVYGIPVAFRDCTSKRTTQHWTVSVNNLYIYLYILFLFCSSVVIVSHSVLYSIPFDHHVDTLLLIHCFIQIYVWLPPASPSKVGGLFIQLHIWMAQVIHRILIRC